MTSLASPHSPTTVAEAPGRDVNAELRMEAAYWGQESEVAKLLAAGADPVG